MAKKGVSHLSEAEKIVEGQFGQVEEVKKTANDNIADSLKKTTESKEKFIKSLEFEPDTFKIDSTGWREITEADITSRIFSKFVGKRPRVKANITGDVVEYLDWPAKGEQIFITYDAFIREVKKDKNCTQEEVEAKYLMTVDEFKQKMEDKPDNSEEYNKFFEQEVKWHLAGYWNPDSKGFYDIGDRSDMWLAGGDGAGFNESRWFRDDGNRDYGFSGHLLKN